MNNLINRLNIARVLFITSVVVGMNSLLSTFNHIGNDKFRLAGFSDDGTGLSNTHGWYHFLREGVGDVAALVILALLLFGPAVFRTTQTWIIGIIVCLGYYLPFWIGMPFNSALSAPNMNAEITHIIMAVCAFAALFIAKPLFNNEKE